jgi:hypothetical protein
MESFQERNDKMAADILKFPLLLRLYCPRGIHTGNDPKMITLEITSPKVFIQFLQTGEILMLS